MGGTQGKSLIGARQTASLNLDEDICMINLNSTSLQPVCSDNYFDNTRPQKKLYDRNEIRPTLPKKNNNSNNNNLCEGGRIKSFSDTDTRALKKKRDLKSRLPLPSSKQKTIVPEKQKQKKPASKPTNAKTLGKSKSPTVAAPPKPKLPSKSKSASKKRHGAPLTKEPQPRKQRSTTPFPTKKSKATSPSPGTNTEKPRPQKKGSKPPAPAKKSKATSPSPGTHKEKPRSQKKRSKPQPPTKKTKATSPSTESKKQPCKTVSTGTNTAQTRIPVRVGRKSKERGRSAGKDDEIKAKNKSPSKTRHKKKLVIKGLQRFCATHKRRPSSPNIPGSSCPSLWLSEFPCKGKFHPDNYIYDWIEGPKAVPRPVSAMTKCRKHGGRCDGCGIFTRDICTDCRKCEVDCACMKKPKPRGPGTTAASYPFPMEAYNEVFGGDGWKKTCKVLCELTTKDRMHPVGGRQNSENVTNTPKKRATSVGRNRTALNNSKIYESQINVLNPHDSPMNEDNSPSNLPEIQGPHPATQYGYNYGYGYMPPYLPAPPPMYTMPYMPMQVPLMAPPAPAPQLSPMSYFNPPSTLYDPYYNYNSASAFSPPPQPSPYPPSDAFIPMQMQAQQNF